MKTLDLVQGTKEWLAHRLQSWNASDAPAMMGCSRYETRQQLIKRLATGIAPEVDAATQRRFDEGHRFEKLARPLAEQLIGEDLFPVTGTEGKLSASFDGLTMCERRNWEHKRLNSELRAILSTPGCTGADLPLAYRVQCEQQHMVSKAEATLFMASNWTPNDDLIEELHCWYTPNPELAEQIAAGWVQLEADVAAYVPEPVTAVVVATPVQALPAVSVVVDGTITIRENFDAFEVAARDFLENRLIREPKTDQDFADLDLQIKAMKGAEAALDAAEVGWIAQIEPVSAAKKRKDMLHKLMRDNRLLAEKLLTTEKDRRRIAIVTDAREALAGHVIALNTRLGKPYMPTIPADFAAAIKGLRSLASMEDAVASLLANSKIAANAAADRIQANLTTLRELAAEHTFLFADTPAIVQKAPDDLTALVKSRIADHTAAEQKRQEAERARIRAEEQERADREARERVAREQREATEKAEREQREAAAQAEAQRQRDEAAQAAVATPTPAPSAAPVPAAQQPAVAPVPTPATVHAFPTAAAKPTPAPATPPALKLGVLNNRIAPMQITADGLRELGFEPAAKERGAVLYHEVDFPHMLAAMVRHLEAINAQQAA